MNIHVISNNRNMTTHFSSKNFIENTHSCMKINVSILTRLLYKGYPIFILKYYKKIHFKLYSTENITDFEPSNRDLENPDP